MSRLYPCLRGVVGEWTYYSTLMSAAQISESVSTSKDIREQKSLEDFLQRELRERVRAIERYLRTTNLRFFNSLVVGVFDAVPEWYEFDLASIRTKDIDVAPNELSQLQESVGLLRLTGAEKMFAIDGQHRARAIKELWEDERQLPRNKQTLADDQFSVLFVAHVDDETGKKRTRRLFSDINKRAVPVSKGDLAIIDEDDICAIVARRLYAQYAEFRAGALISLTEVSNLDPHDTTHFTNLITLVRVNRKLKKLHRKKRHTKEWHEENVQDLLGIARDFYDFIIAKLTPLQDLFAHPKKSLKKLRQSEPNLLARPIGLVLVAEVYRYFALSGRLSELGDRIDKLDFSESGHFDKLLWSNGRIETRHLRLAVRLSLHLLGELSRDETASLKVEYGAATKQSRSLPAKLK